MKYTETWTWTKNIRYYVSSNLEYTKNRDGIIYKRPKTYLEPWMKSYRDKIQAIKTNDQAAHVIQAYWRDVVKEWEEHLNEQKESKL